MINNYKAKKTVRAEAVGEIYKGRPASVYIKEDEYKVENTNIIDNGDFETGSVLPWVNDDMDTFAISTSNATKTYALHMTVGDADDKASVAFTTNTSKTYKLKFNRVITNLDSGSDINFTVGTSAGDSTNASLQANASNSSTGRVREEIIFSPTATTTYFSVVEYGSANDADIYIDDIQCVEITDFSYKLMAVSDSLPAVSIATSGLMSTLLDSDVQTALGAGFNSSSDQITFFLGSGTDMTGTDKFTASGATYAVNGSNATGKGKLINTGSAQGYVSLPFISVVGHKYILSVDVLSGDNSNVDISLSSSTSWNTGAQNLSNNTSTGNVTPEYTADDTTSFILIRNTSSTSGEFSYTDNIRVYGIYGYDAFVAPTDRGGIVTNIWDASTGKLKDPAAAGDTVEVQYQGETTTAASASDAETLNQAIEKINSTGEITAETVADSNLPNAMGVISDPDYGGAKENEIILFQGVAPPVLFSYSNSVTVNAKCSEAITKFRPVSLYLDSAGDLICKHNDIPNESLPSDRDYLSATPGKWGMPELSGATDDTIPITVAGKTHINTSTSITALKLITQLKEDGTVEIASATNNYTPNALGTTIGEGTGDIAITIFNGVPTGTISNWRYRVKITAKANGTITQYCPVSIYVDNFGKYICISDDIPNNATDDANAIWVESRRWGIAQVGASDGENVEIIIKGRTKVVDTLDSANRTEFVTKIDNAGVVTSSSNTSMALTSLGIVETEAKASTNTQGTIIIY